MNRYLLDANIILRFLRDDHRHHSPRAISLFAQAAAGESILVISDVVLAECVWVLQSFYRTDRKSIANTLAKLITKPGIEVSENSICRDALHRFGKTNVDYIDCYLAARAAAHDETIASFDKDFRKFPDVRLWK